MWHASVALRSRLTARPIPRALWSPGDVRDAKHLLRALLRDVGQGITKVASVDTGLVPNGVALHAKRVLSIDEQAGLDPAWCALPAIDQAGDGPMEEVEW